MPVSLGARPQSGFDDPLGLLSDCHRRIESFLGILIRVAELASGESAGALPPDHRAALEAALRYFREAAPRHTRDEEDSLFPRMREADDLRVREALAAVARLEREHAEADSLHAEVDRLGRQWLAGGRLQPAENARLRVVLLRLQGLYREHIALEDGHIFPLAAKSMSPAQLRAVGVEMAARRGLGPPAAGVGPPPSPARP